MKKSKSAKIQIKLHKDIRKLLKKFEKNPNVYWDNRHLFGELIDNWLEISKIDEQLLVKYRELKQALKKSMSEVGFYGSKKITY